MSQRRFGVEIEHYHPEDVEGVEDLLVDNGYLVASGLDEENWWRYTSDHEWRLANVWHTTEDGSGVELKTPALKGEKGFNTLRKVMNLLSDSGGYTTWEDGMHVHHEAYDFVTNKPALERLLDTWHDNEGIIESMVDPFRRNNVACRRSITKERIDRFKQNGESISGRGALNCGSVSSFAAGYPVPRNGRCTIEIRLHEGTLDPDVAIAWVRFGQRLLDACIKDIPIRKCNDVSQLLRRVRAAKSARLVLEEKALSQEHIEAPSYGFRNWDYY